MEDVGSGEAGSGVGQKRTLRAGRQSVDRTLEPAKAFQSQSSDDPGVPGNSRAQAPARTLSANALMRFICSGQRTSTGGRPW